MAPVNEFMTRGNVAEASTPHYERRTCGRHLYSLMMLNPGGDVAIPDGDSLADDSLAAKHFKTLLGVIRK
jgi:hypothetical protein